MSNLISECFVQRTQYIRKKSIREKSTNVRVASRVCASARGDTGDESEFLKSGSPARTAEDVDLNSLLTTRLLSAYLLPLQMAKRSPPGDPETRSFFAFSRYSARKSVSQVPSDQAQIMIRGTTASRQCNRLTQL